MKKPASSEELSADLLLLRRQKENAQILMNLIGEEGRGIPPAKTQRVSGRGLYRLILGAFLLLVWRLCWYLCQKQNPNKSKIPPGCRNERNTGRLASGDKVLVVLEYQAATSPELEQIAAPVLREWKRAGLSCNS
jgi:hypothetical protein